MRHHQVGAQSQRTQQLLYLALWPPVFPHVPCVYPMSPMCPHAPFDLAEHHIAPVVLVGQTMVGKKGNARPLSCIAYIIFPRRHASAAIGRRPPFVATELSRKPSWDLSSVRSPFTSHTSSLTHCPADQRAIRRVLSTRRPWHRRTHCPNRTCRETKRGAADWGTDRAHRRLMAYPVGEG
jgi:hypothetical protein